MKSYNKLIIGLAVCISLVGAQSCLAAVQCKSGTIDEVGVNPQVATDPVVASPYFVKFTCNDQNATWTGKGSRQYVIPKDYDTSMYATALTAMASGKNICAILANLQQNSLITKLTIVNQ